MVDLLDATVASTYKPMNFEYASFKATSVRYLTLLRVLRRGQSRTNPWHKWSHVYVLRIGFDDTTCCMLDERALDVRVGQLAWDMR